MKVISAYMLAVTGGNDSPNVADCKKILSSVGVELSGDEEKRLEELVEEMAGTSLAEVLEKGHALLKTIQAAAVLPPVAPPVAAMPLRQRRSPPPKKTTVA